MSTQVSKSSLREEHRNQVMSLPTLYPSDPFVDTVYHYASVFWYVIAWLSRFYEGVGGTKTL